MDADVLVIGAGAAGLAAARTLRSAGLHVRIIEARERIGGRIHGIRVQGLEPPVEFGAEFIHGLSPASWDLIREGSLPIQEISGPHLFRQADGLRQAEEFGPSLARLLELPPGDLPFSTWTAWQLRTGGWSEAEASLARSYVEGFYGADVDRASTRAIALSERAARGSHADLNFRVATGYNRLTDFLSTGLDIRLHEEVSVLRWKPGQVVAELKGGGCHQARRAVIALPLGVLRSGPTERGAVAFEPALGKGRFQGVESGEVLKVTLRFSHAFWLEGKFTLPPMSFVHLPDGSFPTWWHPWPEPAPLLVAWAGGNAVDRLLARDSHRLVDLAIDDLARLLSLQRWTVENALVEAWHWDWNSDPYSRGSYSYVAVDGLERLPEAIEPVAGTLFFAGEWTDPDEIGTVHGAIASGERAASEVLQLSENLSAQPPP